MLSTKFMKKLNACYSKDGKNEEFMENNNLNLEDCLEEILDFCMQGSNRRSVIDGVKTFYGLSVKQIISLWHGIVPELEWLWENFNITVGKCHDIATVSKVENVFEILHNQTNFYSMKKEEAKEKYKVKRCARFAVEFLNVISGENQDKFKPIFSFITQLIDVKSRQNGHCKMKVTISEMNEETSQLDTVSVTCVPDFIFTSDTDDICMPVELYVPDHDKMQSFYEDNTQLKLNNSQEPYMKTQFRAQHLMQHVGLMSEILVNTPNWKEKNNDSAVLNKQQVSVGMFVMNNKIYFSNVHTTPGHLSSFIQDLLPDFAQKNHVVAKMKMSVNKVKDGLKQLQSNWSIDLKNGVHRHALMVFLVHYLTPSGPAVAN